MIRFFILFFFISVSLSSAALKEQELVISSEIASPFGKCDLGATLLIPHEAHALVIFVHGSGPLDRDETFEGGYTTFKDIAEFISSHGVATLRYDKRTYYSHCVEPFKQSIKFSPYYFMEDVENVIAFSKTYQPIKHLPLVLLGHSQGVNFVLELAARQDQKIDGTILLAGLGRYAIDETILRQLEFLVSTDMYPDQTEILKKYLEEGKVYFDRLRKGLLAPSDSYFFGYLRWWEDWIEITERASSVAAKSPVPTLLLQGSLDWNITFDDFEALRAATVSVVGSDSEMFSGLYHVFTQKESNRVDLRVLKKISSWLERFSNR